MGFFPENGRKDIQMFVNNLMAIGENITPDSPIGDRLSTGLLVALIGMSVVFGILLIIMGILYVFKLFSAKNGKAKVPAAVVTPAAQPSVSSAADGSEEEQVAVITAALTALNNKSDAAYRIKSINKIVE